MAKMNPVEIADGQNAGVRVGGIARGPGLRRSKRCQPAWSGARTECLCITRFAIGILIRIHLHFELQAVVSQLHVRKTHAAKALVGFRVRKVVSDVRKPCAARFETLDQGQGLVHGLMHGVRNIAQGVQDEFVEALEKGHRRFGQAAEIREISGAAETETQNLHVAVLHRDGHERNAKKLDRSDRELERNARDGAERGFIVKDVREHAADDSKGLFVAVDGECCALANIERANIVEPENVVGVAVGKQNGVNTVEPDAKSLLAKIRRRIDDDVLAIAGNQKRRAKAIVVGIIRMANAAGASKRGHAHGRSGAENGYFEWSGRHLQKDVSAKWTEKGKPPSTGESWLSLAWPLAPRTPD